MTTSVNFKKEGGVAFITFNRPDRGNAITPDMGKEIQSTLNDCKSDPSIVVVVFTGKGKFFCTGMDLGSSNQQNIDNELQSGQAAADALQLYLTIKNFPKPTVAAINGPVYGGGCGIVFCCDIRIGVKNAFLCFSEVKRGIVPALISSVIVPQLGESLSLQYMTTGMKLYVSRLYELGLVSALTENVEELHNKVGEFIAELRTSAPNATSTTKKTVQYCATHSPEESYKHVKNVFTTTVHSEEALYGISCFVSKQQPDWSSLNNIPSKL